LLSQQADEKASDDVIPIPPAGRGICFFSTGNSRCLAVLGMTVALFISLLYQLPEIG
jgi:hypothetical protein